MVKDTDLLRCYVSSLTESPYIYGTAEDCIKNIAKLKLLKNFGIISDDYYNLHTISVLDALEELYNITDFEQVAKHSLQYIKVEEQSEDWQDSLTVYKDRSDINIEKISDIINTAYISNKTIKLFNVHAQELLHARIRSFNGDAYAIDLLDTDNKMYTLTDTTLVSSIVRGRKFMFETTYGFISCEYKELIEFSDILFNMLQNKKFDTKNRLSFLAYSDIFNMPRTVDYDTIDIYALSDATEELKNLQAMNVVTCIEITDDLSDKELYLFISSKYKSNINFYVDKIDIQLDKYSENLVRQITVRNNDGQLGKLVLPYEIGDDPYEILQHPFCIESDENNYINVHKIGEHGEEKLVQLSLPFDTIENRFSFKNKNREDTLNE